MTDEDASRIGQTLRGKYRLEQLLGIATTEDGPPVEEPPADVTEETGTDATVDAEDDAQR